MSAVPAHPARAPRKARRYHRSGYQSPFREGEGSFVCEQAASDSRSCSDVRIAAPRRAREVTGLGYAAAILGVSYFGFLPMLNLHPPAHRDHWNRQVANAAGHAVYGLTLAVAMRLSDTNANP